MFRSPETTLEELGIQSATQFDVQEIGSAGDDHPGAAGGGAVDLVDEAQWSCPQCTLLNPVEANRCSICDCERPGASAPSPVPAARGNGMERLTVPADNNCLFACVGYLLIDRSKRHGRDLRQVVADEVRRNPETYSAAVLEKPPGEYIAWILRDSTWGGGVELSILANHFECELAAIEVRTQTLYVFGESRGFTRRVYLVWDGIHYDMIVRSTDDGSHETVFSPSDHAAEEGALQLVRELHASRQFTDTSNFTLMCLEDNVPLRGQEEAMEHARRTGHTNFAEYDPSLFAS